MRIKIVCFASVQAGLFIRKLVQKTKSWIKMTEVKAIRQYIFIRK